MTETRQVRVSGPWDTSPIEEPIPLYPESGAPSSDVPESRMEERDLRRDSSHRQACPPRRVLVFALCFLVAGSVAAFALGWHHGSVARAHDTTSTQHQGVSDDIAAKRGE